MKTAVASHYADSAGAWIGIQAAYDPQLVETIKATVPAGPSHARTRWYRDDSRTWYIRPDWLPGLRAALRQIGWQIIEPDPFTAPPKPAAGTWADQMYAELTPGLAVRAYRALVAVLHPDAGGDVAAMQQLNAARDRANGGTR